MVDRLPAAAMRSRVEEVTEQALAAGALIPIPTTFEIVEDAGVRFVVRVVDNLARKEMARRQQRERSAQGRPDNPFLPYEPELFVGDISSTHVCLLNKFNVLDHHMLLVTRAFVDQETLLEPSDFEALWRCLGAVDGLGFYNGGEVAGASQRHRHLQLAPYPIARGVSGLPVDALFENATWEGDLGHQPRLPCKHAFMRCAPGWVEDPLGASGPTLNAYERLLEAVGIPAGKPGQRQSAPYNLLVTRSWMLMVPRSREHYETISVNAIGYGGCLLVRNAEELALVRRVGPMRILAETGEPYAGSR